MSTAEEHARRAARLFDRIGEPAPPQAIIAAFDQMLTEVDAGLRAVDADGAEADVVRVLEILHDACRQLASAGMAACVIERARQQR
jgi:hypothetical protein